MFSASEYQLVDFGAGRKLERFGPYLDRPPGPQRLGIAPADPAAWPAAEARYERAAGIRGKMDHGRRLAGDVEHSTGGNWRSS